METEEFKDFLEETQLEQQDVVRLKQIQSKWKLDDMTSLQAISAIFTIRDILLCSTKMGKICLFSEDQTKKNQILSLPKTNDYILCFGQSCTNNESLFGGSSTGQLYSIELSVTHNIKQLDDLQDPIIQISHTKSQNKANLCICHPFTIKLMLDQDGGKFLLL